MFTTSPANTTSRLLLAQYAHELGHAALPQDASRLNLSIDGRYRVQLRAVDAARVMIRSRLDAVPPAGPARDAALRRIGQMACVSMARSPVACVIDGDEDSFWLHQLSEPQTLQDIDALVGDFVNELAFWVGSLQ